MNLIYAPRLISPLSAVPALVLPIQRGQSKQTLSYEEQQIAIAAQHQVRLG